MSARAITRRAALATAAAAPAAVPSFTLALGAEGPDAELLRACGRMVELQYETVRLLKLQAECKEKLPPEFQGSGIDPRDWQEIEGEAGAGEIVAFAKAYLPHYLAVGLHHIHDQLDPVRGEHHAIIERLVKAKPRTVAGALALARVWLLETGDMLMVKEDPEDFGHMGVTAGLRALDTAEAFATREAWA